MRKTLSLCKRWLLLSLLACLLLAGVICQRLVTPARPADPVTAAWQRAHAAGSYHFSSDVTQITIPVASVSNVGRSSRTEKLHLEGQNDLRNGHLEMKLWSNSGSLVSEETSLGVRVEKNKTFVRLGLGEWQQKSDFSVDALAPQGDFLAFLRTVRDVTAHAPETRAGIVFTRYSFVLDGPEFAALMREQMETALRTRGELPASVHLDVPRYYRDMAGEGELWVRDDGLPLRQIMTLRFPEQNGKQLHAQITVDFSRFGNGQLTASDEASFFGLLSRRLPDFSTSLVLLSMLAGMALMFRYQHTRLVERALALAIIASMVAGPLLTAMQIDAFFAVQEARAAQPSAQEAESTHHSNLRVALGNPSFEPHISPLSTVERYALAEAQYAGLRAAHTMHLVAAPAAGSALLVDDGTDTDGDTLTDFVEERIGTSKEHSDTDGDLIPDNEEVLGKVLDGQTWYPDPTTLDSNGDSIPDGIEWGSHPTDALDTDGDSTPDVFDDDNDGDGVPDSKDLAPFVVSPALFDEENSLQLTLHNVTPGVATFVEFQIRPNDPEHLWYAFNVLDWPSDSQGQVQDVDNVTYADLPADGVVEPQPSEDFGDMKLIPMLEIRVQGPITNLPSQTELTPYNIILNNLNADGSEQVVYLPLNIITNEMTGERVAFNAKMRYAPTGTWPTPHKVNLVWVVQVLSDIPCDTSVAGCNEDDPYLHNVGQVVQTYPDAWKLTGLTVREEHGAAMAIIYEDPSVDPDKHHDATLWALSHGMEHQFANGVDADQDGDRDLKLSDFASRFDHTMNSGKSPEQRWGIGPDSDGDPANDIPNVLRVDVGEPYETFDRAVATATMTETQRVLDQNFKSLWQQDNTLKPLLLFAYERSERFLGLDRTEPGFITLTGHSVIANMAPSAQPAITVDIYSGFKWRPYCGPIGPTGLWESCEPEVYWQELVARFGELVPIDGTTNDPHLARGQMALTQVYHMAMVQGLDRVVERDAVPFSGDTNPKDDAALSASLKAMQTGASGIARPLAGFIANTIVAGIGDGNKATKALGVLFSGSATPADFRDTNDVFHLSAAGHGIVRISILAVQTIANIIGASLTKEQLDAGGSVGIKVITTTTTIALQVAIPIYDLVTGAAKATPVGAAVGAVVAAGITWGFFIYNMVSNNVSAFSPAFNAALAQTIAATIYIIVVAAVSATVIGSIITGIIAAIDAILGLACEIDKFENGSSLLDQSAIGGCITIGTVATKAIAYLLYNFDVMIDTTRADLITMGGITTQLADPEKGLVAGNAITITLPVTTHIAHKDPDPANGLMIFPYLWLYSADNLKLTTYQVTASIGEKAPFTPALNAMADEWQNVEPDHNYVLTPMYGATASTDLQLGHLDLPAGINRPASFYMNSGYALTAYECWALPNPVFPTGPPIPICYINPTGVTGTSSSLNDNIRFDILPATLDGFMALVSKGDGGLGLAWDANFLSLADADGDGLLSSTRGGLDPNDATWDADGDGLADRYELERRAAGVAYSPILRDTDNDGLTDLQEMQIGTNPVVADSDNDGLTDGEEVWHRRYDPTTGAPTNIWEGGWDVTINSATPFTVRVSSDPLKADSDNDGVSDQAERQLALDADLDNRVDDQERPYHPRVFNTPPIAVYTTVNDRDGYVGAGQSLIYTTTVVANVPLAPGVLDVTLPAQLGSSPVPYALDFSTSATITQQAKVTVVNGAAADQVSITSTVRTRLPNGGAAGWVFDPVVTEAPLGGFILPNRARFIGGAASRPDRQDSFLLSALVSTDSFEVTSGDIMAYAIPGGQSRAIEDDNNNSSARRGFSPPSVATNRHGKSLVVWDQFEVCNTLTINWLKVVAVANDPFGGIEPFLTRGSVSSENRIWRWDTAGGTNDMKPGDQRGPNAFGFPLVQPFCGAFDLYVWESDGGGDESVGHRAMSALDGQNNQTLTFIGAGHTIEINVSIPIKDHYNIAGAIVAPDGTVQRRVSFPRPTNVETVYKIESRRPVVASNDDGFLVAYEAHEEPRSSNGNRRRVWIAVQAFDRDGNALASSAHFVGNLDLQGVLPGRVRFDMVWMGDRYRVAWRPNVGSNIEVTDFATNGTLLGARSPVVSDAIVPMDQTVDGSPRLAYDPVTGRWLLAYIQSTTAQGAVNIYPNINSTSPQMSTVLGADRRQVLATYHPQTQGWLLTFHNSSEEFISYPLQTATLNLLTDGPQVGPAAGSPLPSGALACPAPISVAVADLRFEELPGATTFMDSSGRNNNATCSDAACPAAGLPGAPNAPLSDYAIEFDGIDDMITLVNPVNRDFTMAFWYNSAATQLKDFIIDGGVATGIQLVIFNTFAGIQLTSGGSSTIAPINLNDGQWHYVAATRDGASGRLAIYLDGNPNPVASLAGSNTPAPFSTLSMGGLKSRLDQFQIYPVALSGDTIQALYNRELQSYCVAARPNADQSGFLWARLQVQQRDTRGGRITASGGLKLSIDNDTPTSAIGGLSDGDYVVGNASYVIGGNASDPTSSVDLVEVSVNNGPWQAANGTESWAFNLAVTEDSYSIRTRATDAVGNVEPVGSTVTIHADATPPSLAVQPLPALPIVPTRDAGGQWSVTLSGAASDSGSGLNASAVEVLVTGQGGTALGNGWQAATLNGETWTINYAFAADLIDPTGVYQVSARATDKIGNSTGDILAADLLRLDSAAPTAALNLDDAMRPHISETLTISGIVSDTLAGIDKVEVSFTPVELVASLPNAQLSDAVEEVIEAAGLPWYPATLAQRGPGVVESSWSLAIPAGLEGMYQIDLRNTDVLGNRGLAAYVWRGVIDTRDPRIVMTAMATGASYFDAASNAQRHEMRFVCAAVDGYLDEATFVCPGQGVQEPVRSFADHPALQQLFPDLTVRDGLAISYTLWTTTTTPAANASACDFFGRCATASTPVNVHGSHEAAMPDAPLAFIVAPTQDSYVAANDALSVTIAAEAGAFLKQVVLRLDDQVVGTLTFAENSVTRTLRTVSVPIIGEGVHTLEAEATDWSDTAQAILYPVSFTLDSAPPTLTLDSAPLTVADTWQLESGMLRFHGTVNDSVGLATVQIREVDPARASGFVDATFGNGVWRAALFVQDPEGRDLTIEVRAVDLAGRTTAVSEQISVNVSAADAPDTIITASPDNPSDVNSASFAFSGSSSVRSVPTFDCQLDSGAYTPCNSPQAYSDLNKGDHTFRVRAIDSQGFADLSPATYSWRVNGGQPDATITGAPDQPTTSRSASFTFSGDSTAESFECSLDGRPFTTCASPQSYTDLRSGAHTFLVRGVDNANKRGAADRFDWTIQNDMPVAIDQTVVVIPNVAKAITLSANDSDSLVYRVVRSPAHGILFGTAPHLVYAPDTGFAGIDSFTFRAGDGLLDSELATVTLLVDNTPPTVTCSASPNRLWPPNNRLVDIATTVIVSDEHSGPAGFILLSVSNNETTEPSDMPGWDIDIPDTSGQLRASRAGNGNGRIYTLTYEGKDVAGNVALCHTIVFVPHNQGQPNPTVAAAVGEPTMRTAPDETASIVQQGQESHEDVSLTDRDPIDDGALANLIFLPLAMTIEPTHNQDMSDLPTKPSATNEGEGVVVHQLYLPMLIR